MNIFSAPRGSNDDHCMALIWGLYFINTVFFDGKKMGVKKIDDKFKLSLEDTQDDTPIMFLGNDVHEEDLEQGWGHYEGLDKNKDSFFD